MTPHFWCGKRVLLTGHTGFKGSWLSLWLQKLNANVLGYSLPPPSNDCMFHLCKVGAEMESVFADIRDAARLRDTFSKFCPEIVFHLAAQPLVRRSYIDPLETYQVNVMGTVHLLEAARQQSTCAVVVNITSDKCYENKEWLWGYREMDELGGHDPYSSSKACAELVTAAYRQSYFEVRDDGRPGLASARAGNVVGGGDFSNDRIVPDFLAAARGAKPLHIRHPDAVRPWQHVLDALSGYLELAEKLWDNPAKYAQGWNFGPTLDDVQSVHWIVKELNSHYGGQVAWETDAQPKPHEARLLMLDSTKAQMLLGWRPRWTLKEALEAVVNWQKAYERGSPMQDMTMQQISSYEAAAA